MSKVITAPGVLKNVQGQIDHVTDMYDDIKDNNLKPLTVTLDTMTNADGAYSHTTSDDRITEDMKPVTLEVGTPECFYAPVVVTTGSGTATVTCEDAHGNSTITVTFVKTSPVEGGEDYPPAVTSTEFDILADRIGSLATLDTSTKASAVAAINEVVGNIGTVPSGKTVEGQIDDINGKLSTVEDKKITRVGNYFTERDAFKARRVGNAIVIFSYVNISNAVSAGTNFADIGFSSAEGMYTFMEANGSKATMVTCTTGKLKPTDATLATGYYYVSGCAVTPV